jgi:hypothetical protein
MNVTVNQIRQEMATLVQAHDMVNSFFWGDFHRAYNEKDQFYPLVCSYLSDGAINTNMTQMQLVVIVCDKTFKGFENLNDTESDTVTVARHLYNVIRQSPRWNALLRVNSATLSKFYENTSDEVAGVILTMNVDIKQSRSLCGLPLDNYDFDGQFVGNECEPVLIVNSNQSFSFNAPSGTIVELPDTPVLVTDQDGNELANENLPSVTGGTIQVETGGVCLPANYVVEYADGTPIESGEIPSGESATVVVPNCEPCEDATYQLTLDGEPLEGGSGSIPSGENANIPIDEFIPECDPAIVTWDGDTDFPIATLECGDTLDVDCETLINGVVVEVEGDEFFIGFFRVVGGFPVYTLEDVGAVSYSINRWTINLAGVSIIEANTGTEEFPWLATWGEGVTVRQATISDACCDCEPTPCEDATVQINGEEVATVASGGMVNIAVENESGTPLGAFNEETGVWVVPDCPPPSNPQGGMLPFKTGQTTVYETGDDGTTQRGQAIFTLPFTNPFGNTTRFLDTLGGTTYADDITLDLATTQWATPTTGTFMGYVFVNVSANWAIQVANALAATHGGYSGWSIINDREMVYISFDNGSVNNSLNHSGLLAPDNVAIWTGKTNTGNTATAVARTTGGIIGGGTKTATTFRRIDARLFNFSVVGGAVILS